MRTVFCAVAAMAALPVAALAAGADRDEDGRITREELAGVHALIFDQLDADHDGVVSGAEADAHFLDIADRDRDGQVTREENEAYAAGAAAQDLAACDANGDEALTGDEVTCITSSDSFE